MKVDKFETLVNLGLNKRMVPAETIVYGYIQKAPKGFEAHVEDTVVLYSSKMKENYEKLGSINLKDFNQLLKIII